MRSSILDSPWFESRQLPNSSWDLVKAMHEFRPYIHDLPATTISNNQELHTEDDTCPIMRLPDELFLLIFENVEFSPTNYKSIACVNKRFNSLVHDTLLGYNAAQLQFLPYKKLMESAWREKRHKRNASRDLLRTVYDMHRVDAPIIKALHEYSGHSSHVCMTLITLFKLIISEAPRANSTRSRAEMIDPLERHRIVLFRVRLARTYLSPEALVLMRYTVETIRRIMGRQASTLVRSGWLSTVPPFQFSYYSFFEDCLLRYHSAFVWNHPIVGSSRIFNDQIDRVDIFAKMFERQEEFLGQDIVDYEDDVSWAAMMTMHHEWGHALWSDLTAEQKKMIQQQALLPQIMEGEEDELQSFTYETDEVGILQIGNLSLADNNPGPNPADMPSRLTRSVRLYKADEVHENLMLLTLTKYGDKECMEKALDRLDLTEVRDEVQKGREKIWTMNLEECMQAVAKEVETTELRFWLSGSIE